MNNSHIRKIASIITEDPNLFCDDYNTTQSAIDLEKSADALSASDNGSNDISDILKQQEEQKQQERTEYNRRLQPQLSKVRQTVDNTKHQIVDNNKETIETGNKLEQEMGKLDTMIGTIHI